MSNKILNLLFLCLSIMYMTQVNFNNLSFANYIAFALFALWIVVVIVELIIKRR